MKVVQFHAENFKRLKTVEITPDGTIVTIGGKNGTGKSSVLDAIYVGLVGRSAAPPRPVRDGEEECIIRLDLGDIKVTRKFIVQAGGTYTDSLKVENADGLRYGKPQLVLDALLGEIGFDPFAFVGMKPDKQAETLLGMVPLTVDLDELADADTSDYANRRDVNRDAGALEARLAAIPKEDVPKDAPGRDDLTDKLATAADHNSAIERDRSSRDERQRTIEARKIEIETNAAGIAGMIEQIKNLELANEQLAAETAEREKELAELPPIGAPIDTDAIREQLRTADATLAAIERQRVRADLETQHAGLVAQSEAFTKAMAEREASRQAALQKAKMPIDGLSFGLDPKGKPVVTFNGVPFEQASTADQIKASTAIAMAANPELRVLRIKDGSLLDDDSMKLISDMAREDDFQLWIEVVGDGGVGVIMEAGEIKPAKESKKAPEPKPEAGKLV